MIYYPQIKTTDADLNAFFALEGRNDDSRIIPIFQLTKPRISKKIDSVQALENHIQKVIKEVGSTKKIILDITDDKSFQDDNLTLYIHDSSNGYIHWVNRVISIKNNYNSNIIPTVIGKAGLQNLADIKMQINLLLSNFEKIALRLPISNNDSVSQISSILQVLGVADKTDKLYLIFDFQYIQNGWISIKDQVSKISSLVESQNIQSVNIILFSSCPASFRVNERSDCKIEKIQVAEYEALAAMPDLNNLAYGDYGFIHPRRNESAGFWLPRVDYVAADGFCYYARVFNRDISRPDGPKGKLVVKTTIPNETAYRKLAVAFAAADFYINDAVESWGRRKISENAISTNKISGKSPSHYISIRANTHMQRVLALMSNN